MTGPQPAQLLEFRLLGGVEVRLASEPLHTLTAVKPRALLVYLAVTGRPSTRDKVAGLLWADMSRSEARTNLRQALSLLKRMLPGLLRITRLEVSLQTEATTVDAHRFQTFLQQAQNADAPQKMALLEAGAALYAGYFLDGFSVPDSLPFEEWLLLERERLHRLAVQALHTLAVHHSLRRNVAAGLRYTGRLLQLEPWREESHRQMMRLLAWDGQVTAALAQYEQCREMLQEALALDPMPETTALYEHILALRDGPRHNLPLSATPFVGRQEELAELRNWLQEPACRLITISGGGGMGKTRLALAAAAQQRPLFLDGVYFLDLSGLTEGAQLTAALAATVQLPQAGGDSEARRLVDALRSQEMLLLLDSAEHLLVTDESRRVLLDLLARLLAAAPALKLLVTSRERLHLAEEWLFVLDGLRLPPPDAAEIAAYDSVQLFRQAAGKANRHFRLTGNEEAVLELCRLVEGSPLALTLAAALTANQSCRQVTEALRTNQRLLSSPTHNVPHRLRSVQATLDYSWQMLSGAERRLLARLALFCGGFERKAAAAVAGAGSGGLQRLLDKSLLQQEEGRYRLHELTRHFAAARLAEMTLTEEAGSRHSHYYLELLATEGEALNGPEMARAAAAIQTDLDNVRQAWQWAVQRILEPASMADLSLSSQALARFCITTNQFATGEALLEKAVSAVQPRAADEAALRPLLACLLTALAQVLMVHRLYERAAMVAQSARQWAERCAQTELSIRAGLCYGAILYQQGRYQEALSPIEAGIARARQVGLPHLEARGLQYKGSVAYYQADYRQAEAAYVQALAYYEPLAPRFPRQRSGLLNNIGNVALQLADYERASMYYHEALALRQATDQSPLGGIVTVDNLGLVHLRRGEAKTARAYFEKALRLYRQTGNRQGESRVLGNLASLHLQQKEYERARQLAEEDLALMQSIGRQAQLAARLVRLAAIHHGLGQLRRARRYAEQGVAGARARGEENVLAQGLTYLGRISAAQGDGRTAAAAYQEAVSLRRRLQQTSLALEPLARLARLALDAQDLRQAQTHVREIEKALDQTTMERIPHLAMIQATCSAVRAATGLS